MNLMLNQILEDWAYKVNDGCPDPQKRSHLQILEAVLRQHKYPQNFINNYISQIKGEINESAGDTSATTFYHEIISGIAAVKNVSELKGDIVESAGDTSATTFYHEIISGIAAVKNVSASDFKTGENVKK